jgi:hypothetical protein
MIERFAVEADNTNCDHDLSGGKMGISTDGRAGIQCKKCGACVFQVRDDLGYPKGRTEVGRPV